MVEEDTKVNIQLTFGFVCFGLFLLVIAQVIAEAWGTPISWMPTRDQIQHNQWWMVLLIELMLCYGLVNVVDVFKPARKKLDRFVDAWMAAFFFYCWYSAISIYQINFLI